jgi:adhesin transport system outer membrane protein
LSELFGVKEIPVLSGVDKRYIKSMAGLQTTDQAVTKQVDETNLSASIAASRSFNRESLAAKERTAQAKAQTGQALGLLLPSVSVRVNSGKERSEPSVVIDPETEELIGSDTHTRTDASLTVRQPLFDLPRYLDWQRRKVTEKAREENYRITDGDAYLSTVNTYLSLVSSRLQADVTRNFENQLAELLSYIEKRASAGAASISDMARVRARIQSTLSSRLEQESAHATAGTEFVRLTNVAPQRVRLPQVEDIGALSLPRSFENAIETAMQYNPEVKSLATELQAARIDQDAARGRYLPRFEAEYTDTYTDGAGGSPDTQRDKRLMAVVSWDLYSGGKDKQYNLERFARTKELQYRLDDQRRRVVQALSANYTALETTRERLKTSYDELEAITTATEAMSKRMLSGNQSLLDLLDVYDRYYQARARLVSLHTLEMNTVAQIIRLTLGTPWDGATEHDSQASLSN